MKLYTYCSECNSEINFADPAKDRFILVNKRGEKIDLSCNSCTYKNSYHVNDIKAEESKVIGIVSLFIFLGGISILFIFLWPYLFRTSNVYAISGMIGVLSIPFLVYQAINSGHEARVRYFNIKYYG